MTDWFHYNNNLFVISITISNEDLVWPIRGATFWVISKNHDDAPTKF